LKWIGQHIWSFISRFRDDVYLEDLADPGADTDKFLVVDANDKVGYRTGAEVLSDIGATSSTGDITGVDLTGGTGIEIASETNTTSGDYSATINCDLEGTELKSTGETGTTKFLRVDGDGSCSWQVPSYTTNTDTKIWQTILPGNTTSINNTLYYARSTSTFLELVYSAAPTDLANTSATLYIDDIFGNAVIDYVLFRCYLKDAEYAGNEQRAGNHYQLFISSITGGGQAQFGLSPNQDSMSRVSAPPSANLPVG